MTTTEDETHDNLFPSGLQRADQWVKDFSSSLSSGNLETTIALLVDKNDNDDDDNDDSVCFWRDMVAYTWNIITLEGHEAIVKFLTQQVTTLAGTTWERSDAPASLVITEKGGLEFWCDITTSVGSGKAHVRLNNKNRATTILTVLQHLHSRPYLVGPHRIRGVEQGPIPNRQYWSEQMAARQQQQQQQQQDDYFVVIVGGGQAGLTLGARLQLLQVPYLIVESGPKAGWAWTTRYPSLQLHDPCWYNHMPYIPFPESWPIFCPTSKIATWLDMYAQVMDLNIQTKSRVLSARPIKDKTGTITSWQIELDVTISQHNDDVQHTETTIEKRIITAKHVVFATGNSSRPRTPSFPGTFLGIQLHSSKYTGGRSFCGKRCVVIGSNNSGFDIAQDLWEQGAKVVSMIQRTPSLVVSPTSVLTHGLGALYSEGNALHHTDADLVATTTPYKMLLQKWKLVTEKMRQQDKELHEGLVQAGYQLDFGPDNMGLFAKSATEGGGFYINMGSAELVARGDVSIHYGTVKRLVSNGIVIENKHTNQNEMIGADVIIYATGYDTLDQWVAEICGEDIAQQVGRTWGLGLGHRPKDPGPWQGELRNMWKPTAVEGLWFHGGNLAQSRHYSQFLAIQLAARYLHLPTLVYGIPEPTPASHKIEQQGQSQSSQV